MSTHHEITLIMKDVSAGDPGALDKLLPLLYKELQVMAHRHLRGERAGHTLNTTALVHEAYFKLVNQREVKWENRGHFMGIASIAMRRILVNYARSRGRQKRGGNAPVVPLQDVEFFLTDAKVAEIEDLDEALKIFEKVDQRAAKVIECRFFGGLSVEETAVALNISARTVKRDWRMAKAWLHREMSSEN